MIEIEKLKKIATEETKEEKEVDIHYDEKKKMYTLRIPTKIARFVNIKKSSKFRFIVSSKFSERDKKLKTELNGELINE